MIAVKQHPENAAGSRPQKPAIDPWRALEQEGATEQALNDLLGYLEDDLKIEPSPMAVSCFLEA
jgi:hypothetical protein